jgi:predicted metal-binding transcription factor (methanogenesis marker protein 9)
MTFAVAAGQHSATGLAARHLSKLARLRHLSFVTRKLQQCPIHTQMCKLDDHCVQSHRQKHKLFMWRAWLQDRSKLVFEYMVWFQNDWCEAVVA